MTFDSSMRKFHQYIPEHNFLHITISRDLQFLNLPRTIMFGYNELLVLIKELLSVVLFGQINEKLFKLSNFDKTCRILIDLRPAPLEFINV